MPEPKVLLSGLGIPESPRWHEGRLWLCNWIDRQVLAVGLDGKAEVSSARSPVQLMGYSIDWLPDGRLLMLELLVAGAALDRLVTRRVPVDGLPVLVMSGVAAVAMLAGALVLRADEEDEEDGERDLSVAAVLLDTVADAAAAAGVAVVGAIILATGGWYWLDPAVALTIAVVVAYHALALIRKILTRLRPV